MTRPSPWASARLPAATRRACLRGATAVCASGVLPLAACREGEGRETAPTAPKRKPGEQVTLRHAPWPGAPSRPAQTAVVEAWNRAHPDAQVVEEALPGEGNHYQKLLVQAAADTLPDLTFMQGGNDYVSFAAKGLLLPIEGHIKRDRSFNQQERLHPRSRDIVDLLGHTWGLPVEAGTYVIFYSRSAFEQAGAPLPKRGWTWQDLLDRARRLTRDGGPGGEMQYGYGQGLSFGRVEPWIVQNGARVFDRLVLPTRQRFDSAEVVAAVQFVHELAWRHRFMDTGPDAGIQGKGLWEGKHAMRQEGIWMVPDLAKQMKAPWGMAPLPRGKQEATWMSIDVNVAFRSTKFPDDCYEFLKFINDDGQTAMIELWGRMPVTLNEAHKQTFIRYLKSHGVDDWEVAWDAWQMGYGDHLTPAWPDIARDAVGPAFNRLFGPEGAGTSVAATLREIAPVVQRLLDGSRPATAP